ncbi:mitofilin family membrane protein [Ovoidimarina sediminis]|uniref:mitofilin family membrane protein n=1 Tax=Ovoidimarina sediminis TaxID=3079856 RepID=UPI0029139128|nr:mitofilin family membrane protein [Rhodophyticola sp. MJ-SS7]MDU8942502.1 mitofilin family membrane protein [Rhodophyticola sp. MJ-SS7]
MARKPKNSKPDADEAASDATDRLDEATEAARDDAASSEIEDAEIVSETPPPGTGEGQGDDAPADVPGRDDTAETPAEAGEEAEPPVPEDAPEPSEEVSAEAEATEDANPSEGEKAPSNDGDTPEETTGEIVEEAAVAESTDAPDDRPDDESTSDTAEDAKPAPPPAPVPANANEKPAYAAVVPLLLGGAIAAFFGFVASNIMHDRRTADALSPEDNAAAIAELESGIAGQAARIETLEAVDPGQIASDAVAPVSAEAQALATRLDELSGQLSALSERVETIAMRPTATGIEADEFDAALSEFRDQLNAAISNAQTEITEARQEATRISEEAFSEEQAAVLRGAWAQVTGALQNGGPYAEPLASVREIAEVDVPPGLAGSADAGVPTLSDIQQAFPDAARTALEASIRSDTGEAPLDRLTAFLRVQSGVRSLTPREGDDPDAVLSRVEAALRAGDLDTALAEVGGLPQAGQESLSDWIALANTRLEALQAASELSSSLNTN